MKHGLEIYGLSRETVLTHEGEEVKKQFTEKK